MKPRLTKARVNSAIAILLGGLTIVAFQNCGEPRYQIQGNDSVNSLADQVQDKNSIICDATAGLTTSHGGLFAELFYMTQNQDQNGHSVFNFFDPSMAHKLSQQVYFSQINWKPQRFERGFLTQSGELVKDDNGQTLVEWFALRFHSEILITRDEDEGRYEFATLSDDGVVFEAFLNGSWQSIVSDDGLHSPKMACSTLTLDLKKNVPIPIRYSYFQGPKTAISNILHWRKIPDGQSTGTDPECGKTGAPYFYDFQKDEFLQPYHDFLSHGWTVVPMTAFHLPNQMINACVP